MLLKRTAAHGGTRLGSYADAPRVESSNRLAEAFKAGRHRREKLELRAVVNAEVRIRIPTAPVYRHAKSANVGVTTGAQPAPDAAGFTT